MIKCYLKIKISERNISWNLLKNADKWYFKDKSFIRKKKKDRDEREYSTEIIYY